MISFTKLAAGGLVTLMAAVTIMSTGFIGRAAADCFNVNTDGSGSTSPTPVFNNICNAPYGVGNEADFVRVRQSTNGNDMDNQNNPDYTNTVAGVCNDGDTFDVWNYIHNDASQDDNDNGNGSAVAKNVKLALQAQLGQTGSSFNFSAKVTADNAASVQDNATVTCNDGKQVKLTLGAGSVNLYSPQYGWHKIADSDVNSTSPIGSPTLGSGIQYGCYDYRMVVVYQVKVQVVTQPTPNAYSITDNRYL